VVLVQLRAPYLGVTAVGGEPEPVVVPDRGPDGTPEGPAKPRYTEILRGRLVGVDERCLVVRVPDPNPASRAMADVIVPRDMLLYMTTVEERRVLVPS
jgi:hypothetical protein